MCELILTTNKRHAFPNAESAELCCWSSFMGGEYWFVFGGTHHWVEEVMVVVVPACLLGTYSRYLLLPALYSSNCFDNHVTDSTKDNVCTYITKAYRIDMFQHNRLHELEERRRWT